MTIKFLDEIVLKSDDVEALLAKLNTVYLPAVQSVGVALASQSIGYAKPDADQHGDLKTLWLQWALPALDYPDIIWAFWHLRGTLSSTKGGAAVREYWQFVDSLCLDRKRHTVNSQIPTAGANCPDPVDRYLQPVNNSETFCTAQLTVEAKLDIVAFEQALHSINGLIFAKNMEGSVGAGDYTVDLPGQCNDISKALSAIPGIKHIDEVHYRRDILGIKDASIKNGVWRTLMLRVKPDAKPGDVQAWKQAMMQMPGHVRGIRNWSFGEVLSDSFWTHIWQQEFASVDDLNGEYMLSDYHWAWIDHWFNDEFPDCVVDNQLSHAYCPFNTGFIAA